MKKSKNISITIPPKLLKEAERIAEEEGRTKSELLREALRKYVQGATWRQLRAYGSKRAKELGIKEKDVQRLIEEYRTENR